MKLTELRFFLLKSHQNVRVERLLPREHGRSRDDDHSNEGYNPRQNRNDSQLLAKQKIGHERDEDWCTEGNHGRVREGKVLQGAVLKQVGRTAKNTTTLK